MTYLRRQSVEYNEDALGAFSELPVGLPGYRFDSQLTNLIDTDLWDQSKSSGSTIVHSATERWATLTTNSGGTHYAYLQSHYHAPYTPGRTQRAFITFRFGATPGAGARRRVGYFDGTNGPYFEQNESSVLFGILSGTTLGNQTKAQALWNIDTMGAGALNPSGKTLNLLNTLILVLDMQALYVGRVRMGFDIDGTVYWCHEFDHSNEVLYPYIQQASLPVRYDAYTTNTAIEMNAICASVMSIGGVDILDIDGRPFSSSMRISSVGVTTRRPIFAIRCLQQLNSINQNTLIVPSELFYLVRTNDALLEVVRGGTLTAGGGAPTWTPVSSGYSTVEYSTNVDAISNGTSIHQSYTVAGGANKSSVLYGLQGKVLLCYSHLLGVGDTLAVVATSRTGTSDISAGLGWKEIR